MTAETRYFYPKGSIDYVGYSANNRILGLRWGGKTYRYFDVPADVYNRLEQEHLRKGAVASLATEIVKKAGFRYEVVAPRTEAAL